MASYIPTRDVDLVPWADNFRDLITANPALYGLQPSDAVAIAAVVDPFDTSYAVATNPSTRTPATVAAKDSDKGAMIPILRLYAQTIKLNQGVTNENKVALGIHVNDALPSPVPPPTSLPLLTITGQRHKFVEISIRASETPTSKAKPVGSKGALFFYTAGAVYDAVFANAKFATINTKTPTSMNFTDDQVGMKATIWARWFNQKGELGPVSLPIQTIIS